MQQSPNPPKAETGIRKEQTPLVGPRNEGEVIVNGLKCKALIDSGSQMTSMTCSFWRSHPELNALELQPSNILIEGAAGQKVPYYGVLNIRLEVLGKQYETVPAFVVPDSDYRLDVPLVVGTNVLRASRIHLKNIYGQGFLLQVKEKHPEWYTALQKVGELVQTKKTDVVGPAVYTGQTVHIQVGKEMDLRCKVKAGPRKRTYTALIEAIHPLKLLWTFWLAGFWRM